MPLNHNFAASQVLLESAASLFKARGGMGSLIEAIAKFQTRVGMRAVSTEITSQSAYRLQGRDPNFVAVINKIKGTQGDPRLSIEDVVQMSAVGGC